MRLLLLPARDAIPMIVDSDDDIDNGDDCGDVNHDCWLHKRVPPSEAASGADASWGWIAYMLFCGDDAPPPAPTEAGGGWDYEADPSMDVEHDALRSNAWLEGPSLFRGHTRAAEQELSDASSVKHSSRGASSTSVIDIEQHEDRTGAHASPAASPVAKAGGGPYDSFTSRAAAAVINDPFACAPGARQSGGAVIWPGQQIT